MEGYHEYGDEPLVPYDEDNFLTSHITISRSGQTMLCGVNLVHIVIKNVPKTKTVCVLRQILLNTA